MFSACMISLQSGSCLSCKRMHSVTRAGTCCCKSGSKRHSCSSAATCAPGRYQTISCMHMGSSHHCIMQEQCRAARVYSGQGNRSAETRRSGHLSSIDCSCLLGRSYLGFRIYAWRRCSNGYQTSGGIACDRQRGQMPLKRREMMLLGNPKLALINCLTAGYLGDIIGVQDRPKHWIDAGHAIRQLVHAGLSHNHAIGCDEAPDIV